MPTALVLDLAAFPVTNRFTLRDRMELDRWSEVANTRGEERLVLHERHEGDPSDVGNYVAVYAAGCCWASWGLSRRVGGVVVWDSVTGLDRGCFGSMHEALSWVLERRPGLGPRAGLADVCQDAARGSRPGLGIAPALVEGVGFEPT